MAVNKPTTTDKKPVLIKKAKPAQEVAAKKNIEVVHEKTKPSGEKKKKPTNPLWKAALLTTKKLEESEGKIIRLIYRIIKEIGIEQVEKLVSEAKAIHAGEGMLTANKERVRSLGGVFFQITKQFMGTTVFHRIKYAKRPPQVITELLQI